MLKLVYNASDSQLAAQIMTDLRAHGLSADDLASGATLSKGDVLIPIISAQYAGSVVENEVLNALDGGRQIVPVLVGSPQPAIIDHLDAVDFTTAPDLPTLRALIEKASSPESALPLKVLTPRARKANQQIGLLLVIPVIIMFAAAIYGIAAGFIQRPNDEFDAVETEVVQTRDALLVPRLATLEALLPQNPDEAFVYPATVLAQPTAIRPFVALTATARAETTPMPPATVTP